jgi:hypothetical protein
MTRRPAAKAHDRSIWLLIVLLSCLVYFASLATSFAARSAAAGRA